MRDKNDHRSPLTADEQEYPEPERPLNPQEEAGQSIQELKDPPQAEGDRYPAETEEQEGSTGGSDR